MPLTVEPLHLPETVDAGDAGDYVAFVRASNALWQHDSGTDLFREDAAERLVGLRDTTYVEKIGVVARRGDRPVGFGLLAYSRTTRRNANADVVVAPEHRDRAVEDAILAELERIARARGRSALLSFGFTTVDDGGRRLPSPTGFGSVPLDAWQTRFFQRNGFALGQVERASTFDLDGSFDETDALLDAALAKAGPDYTPVWWRIPTPEEHIDGYVAAVARMDTDPPSGDLEPEQDVWTARRVRAREDLMLRGGQTKAVTAVVHEPTGTIAAFNELVIGADRARPTENHDTLVMPEHRGRRLGTIVKCLGLRHWRELVPESPVVETFNAEENRYMLDVNEAVGFRPAAYSGEWRKELS
ncbi:GNAT family N-acetyltransferase [Microbacterium betulae]|uniref:GNAT family N-acetyltransferase n=1 Tax=Microbacterium betulae TaxID=2981139 RepID=A0AA97FDL4_9MICO|nr:GNAT family N-acetyltransferase [Microbacterium sp. AB]WOF21611.1 GNAT family N-acetyltransferase [Microbacterium sp. AB]